MRLKSVVVLTVFTSDHKMGFLFAPYLLNKMLRVQKLQLIAYQVQLVLNTIQLHV